MKIVGIILILLGLLIFAGSFGAAVVNRATVGDNLNCESAERSRLEMDAAFKAYEEAKGTARWGEAAENYRLKARLFDMSSKSCAERNQEYFYYFLGFVGVGIAGFFTSAIGTLLVLIRRRRLAKTA